MFCPVCKAEYRLGFTHCTECDADLVDALLVEELSSDLALAWRGSDPVSFSAALAALRNAGIPNYPVSDHDQFVWGLAIPRPRYGLLVSRVDLQKALECVSGIVERSPLALGITPEWALKEDKAAESDTMNRTRSQQEIPDDIAPDLKLEQATAEVWVGERGELAEVLQACLRENGIASVIDDSGGSTRIRVVSESEARAREIIREVVEGTPPE
jgi:hypothetical protein